VTVNWGFLGAGFVASRGLAPAVHASRGAHLYAVASRDEQRSTSLEPERVHATYDSLLADERVDAVYISLSNSQHREWVTKSLDAGKHVLCEKPLGLNAQETEEMFATASRSGRLLVEAVWGTHVFLAWLRLLLVEPLEASNTLKLLLLLLLR